MLDDILTNKDKYISFCQKVFVPIYSKSWWLDAVCLPDNWDVWLYEESGNILAAMPYYKEIRANRKYITKAPLTQNNGILFNYSENAKIVTKAAFEERIINAACAFIKSLNLDVYEQQYQTSFTNWLPFFWNYYTAITRYTYLISDTSNLDDVWNGISSKQRSVIKKGQNNTRISYNLDIPEFYKYNEKIYSKQGLKCPFTYELWNRLANACFIHESGKIMCRITNDNMIASISFVVWDEKSLYKLMGGPIPEYAKLDAYSATTWDEIVLANTLGLEYDFEGSVIKRISKSFREYGAIPKSYFRIRKVFNPDIILEEAKKTIEQLNL